MLVSKSRRSESTTLSHSITYVQLYKGCMYHKERTVSYAVADASQRCDSRYRTCDVSCRRTRTVAWTLLAVAGCFIKCVVGPALATELPASQKLSQATPAAPTSSIRSPRSAHDLLLNLRSALESGLLLRDDF